MNYHVAIASTDDLRQRYSLARSRLLSGVTPPDKPRRLVLALPQSHRPDVALPEPVLPLVRIDAGVNKRVRDVLILAQERRDMIPAPDMWSDIIDQVCAKHDVTRAQINSDLRTSEIVAARHEAMYRMSREALMSSPAIARRMGGKDHSTVLSGIKKHAERMARR